MTNLVTSQTPLRISFFGGGTDFPEWYLRNGGSVLSTTINKYCHIVCVPTYPFYDYQYRVVYSDIEVANTVEAIRHPVVREVLKSYPSIKNIEIHYSGDLPAGAGLGASSAFTVGMVNALEKYKDINVDKRTLAKKAIEIEREKLHEVVGCQDQIVASYGGFNKIDFHKDQSFTVTPIDVSDERKKLLESHLMLFYSGIKRRSSTIAATVLEKMKDETSELRDMQQLVDEARKVLLNEKSSILDFGRLLHLNWQIKRSLSQSISNQVVDDMYDKAKKAGAIGGKLLGAGGGGFVLLFVEPKKQESVAEALGAYKRVEFSFEKEGSRVNLWKDHKQSALQGLPVLLEKRWSKA